MPKGTHLSGADRSVNPRLVTSSMLTALETPEGGRTEFTYEPNKIAEKRYVFLYHQMEYIEVRYIL